MSTEQEVAAPPHRHRPIEIRSSQVSNVDFEERIIDVLAVPYDQEAIVEYPLKSGRLLRETVLPGAFAGIETRTNEVTVNRDHDYGRTVGKIVDYEDTPAGLVARAYISRTALGDETLQLAADDVLKASVGMAVGPSDRIIRNGLMKIKRAFLDHLSMVPNPAYPGARVLAVRQEPEIVTQDVGPLHTPNLDEILELLGDDFA